MTRPWRKQIGASVWAEVLAWRALLAVLQLGTVCLARENASGKYIVSIKDGDTWSEGRNESFVRALGSALWAVQCRRGWCELKAADKALGEALDARIAAFEESK